MKRLSIKFRVTLWFALLMLIIEALVLTFIMIINGTVVTNDPESRLISVVNHNVNEVEFDRQQFEFNDIHYYRKGVYTILYDANGTVMRGTAPAEFTANPPLQNNSVRTVACGDTSFYVYDVNVDMVVGSVWLRGIIPTEATGGVMAAIVPVAWSVLPVLLVLSVLGGYLIAWSAMRPVKRLSETVNDISDGQDLKARINLGKGTDEVHQLAASFNNMFDRLERSFEAEQQFTSDASHELRTPTTVILAECSYAKKNAQSEEDYQAALDVIERQAEKMSVLIKSLLEITRLDQGTQKVSMEYADLSDLVSIVCDEQALVAQKGIRLARNIQPDIYADIDVFLISRMLQNLIDNAYKFGVQDGYISVSLCRADAGALLTVRDNGIGIAPENLDKIWQRFYQAEESHRSQNGMGLGLSMVRQIVTLHGGTISVDSAVGKGTTFEIYLPEHKRGDA